MKLRHLACAAASVAALAVAAPAFAGTGYVDIAYSNTEYSSFESDAVTGTAAWSATMFGNYTFQADILKGAERDFPAGPANADYFVGNFHANYRSDRYLMGAYYSRGEVEDVQTWDLGLEAQAYFPNATLTGRVSTGQLVPPGPGKYKNDVIYGSAAFYIRENLAVSVSLERQKTEVFEDTTVVKFGGEWKPMPLPVSLFAEYGSHDSDTWTADNTIAAGVRFTFGDAKTIKERDQKGPGLPTGGAFLRGYVR